MMNTENLTHIRSLEKSQREQSKTPKKKEVINYLLSLFNRETYYLEIGVRNPNDNFKHIKADFKYGVDPGEEFKENPVEFKMTSDGFFSRLIKKQILHHEIRFDVIFIDGLHLAEQVDRDIDNSLKFLRNNGFVVLHDCNPPTEWHARYEYGYDQSPAGNLWNGTTWKAFMKRRYNPDLFTCCIDTDWGIGIISKSIPIDSSVSNTNPFYEFNKLDENRKRDLHLIDFHEFKSILKSHSF